jgi:hypothetical protein
MITSWKEIKINYEDQLKNNQILKDKIKKKNEKEFNQNKRNWKMEFFYKRKGKKEGSTQ